MTIQFGWGWRIALLYIGFVIMMLVLVISSSKQKFDLVSEDYYKDEIAYQQVLDGSKNQAALSSALLFGANDKTITITFPLEFAGKDIEGTINFYSAVDKRWDRTFNIRPVANTMAIDRRLLRHTNYLVKLTYSVSGKNYYMEQDINLAN